MPAASIEAHRPIERDPVFRCRDRLRAPGTRSRLYRKECRGNGMADETGFGKLALLVGGGPAPGINGVISSVTLEALDRGIEVIGFPAGFKWLAQGNGDPYPISTIN